MKKAILWMAVFLFMATLMPVSAADYSWQTPQAKVLPTGDLEWAPKPFVFTPGSSIYYIDFENGDDANSGTSTNAAWKHHPWDENATNIAQSVTNGIHTFVFKCGVIYRGTLLAEDRGVQSGEPGNPMRLTSDPLWGTGEAALVGSTAVESGWVKCTPGDAPAAMPDSTNVWYLDGYESLALQSLWEVHNGAIERIPTARFPNWTVTYPLDPQKDWLTYTDALAVHSNGSLYVRGDNTDDGTTRYLCDTLNLKDKSADFFIGAHVWSEYTHNMGTPHRARDRISSFSTEHSGFNDVVASGWPEQVCAGNRYFLEDMPHFLDSPGEYYQDKEIIYGRKETLGTIAATYPGRIYIRLPGDRDPNQSVIELGSRHYMIDIRHQHDVEISGLSFRFNQAPYRMTWPAVANNRSAVRMVGNCKNITVANNTFEHLVTAVTGWTRGDDPYFIGIYHKFDGASVTEGPFDDVMENIVVSDNDISNIDDLSLAFRDTTPVGDLTPADGYISDFKTLHVMRNRFFNVGLRQYGARQSAISAIHLFHVMQAEIAGNIIERSGGAGINLWSSKHGKGEDLRNRPLNRSLVYHNKVVDSMLSGNDYGGIEIWQGGPTYVFNNISGNAVGRRNYSWYGNGFKTTRFDEKLEKRKWDWISWGFSFYADGMYKSYSFNNIGWGVQNKMGEEWENIDKTGAYEDTFMNMAMFCDVVGIGNHRFNNTAYKFALGLHFAGDKQSRQSLLGNVFADMGHQYIRSSGSLGGSAEGITTSPNNLVSTAYGHNVYHGVPSGGWPRLVGSADWDGGSTDTLQEFKDKMEALNMRTFEAGVMEDNVPLQHPDGHDYRLKLGTVAKDSGVKFFVPWGLYAMAGEWNFMRHPGDVNVVIGENFYMTDEYLHRETYNQIPWNNLAAYGVTLESYQQGDLEDWSPGALRFDGTSTYCSISNAIMRADYVFDGEILTYTNSSGTPYQKYVQNNNTSIYLGEKRRTFDMNTNNLLVEIYFKTLSAGVPLVSKLSNDAGYMLDVDGDGKPRLTLRAAGTNCSRIGATSVNDGNWHHLIAEADRAQSNGIAIYVDGVSSPGVFTGIMPASAVSLTNSADLLVGKGPTGDFFEGEVDFLRICRGNLADAETTIEELYAWQFNGPQTRDFTGAEILDGQRDAGALEMAQEPVVLMTTSNLFVPEGGTASFEVSLSEPPAASITVRIERISGDTNLSVSGDAFLIFSPVTWSNSLTFVLAADQDDDANNSTANFLLSSPNAYTAELLVTEIEDDLGVEINTNELSMSEESSVSYQVRMSLQPSTTLTVSTVRVSGDTSLLVTNGAVLTFTTNDWNIYQEVSLKALADDDLTNETASVRSSVAGLVSAELAVIIQDNDSQQISWPETATADEGGTGSFSISLSHIPPVSRTVAVEWHSGDTNIVLVDGSNLVFDSSNWNVAQQVTLAAEQDDGDVDNEALLRCFSERFNDHYVTVTAIDNDDYTLPVVVDVDVPTPSNVLVVFDEALDIASAETLGNYTLDRGVSVISATLSTPNQVSLLITPLTESLEYTLVVDGVEDLAGNSIVNSSNRVAYYIYKVAKFDFGKPSQTTPGNWNNVTNNTLGVQLVDALNTDGDASEIALEIMTAFYENDSKGVVASNLYPASAQRDGFGVEKDHPSEFKLSNLDSRKPHHLTFFGSRDSSSIPTVTYAVGTKSVELSNVYNTNDAVTLKDIYPDVNGEIVVQVSAGDTEWPNALFGFIGVLEIQYTPSSAIEISVNELDIPEGDIGSFGVRFTSDPGSARTVMVERVSGSTNVIVVSDAELTFTTNTWMMYQLVTVRAEEDDDDWTASNAIIRCSAPMMADKYVTANEVENDLNPNLTLPFSETFEDAGDNAGALGELNGQHGWVAGAGAIVTNSDAHGGSQSLSIPRGSVSHDFLGTPNNIQISFWANPARSDIPASISGEAAAVFYVNTTNNLVAYSNTTAITLGATVVSNGWNKFSIECDYVSKVWNLELNDLLVVSNFAFHGTPASFSMIEWLSSSPDTAWLDDINVTESANPSDTDGDNLPDAWEILYYGDLSSNPDDASSNVIHTVRQAYIAGLDPTDPLASFDVFGPQQNVLRWNGISGRVYTVYWTSNLLSSFQTLETNVPWTGSTFTDTTHNTEQKGFYKIGVELE